MIPEEDLGPYTVGIYKGHIHLNPLQLAYLFQFNDFAQSQQKHLVRGVDVPYKYLIMLLEIRLKCCALFCFLWRGYDKITAPLYEIAVNKNMGLCL